MGDRLGTPDAVGFCTFLMRNVCVVSTSLHKCVMFFRFEQFQKVLVEKKHVFYIIYSLFRDVCLKTCRQKSLCETHVLFTHLWNCE